MYILTQEFKAGLEVLYAGTNPHQLRQEIYRALEQLWQITPSHDSNVNRKEVACLR